MTSADPKVPKVLFLARPPKIWHQWLANKGITSIMMYPGLIGNVWDKPLLETYKEVRRVTGDGSVDLVIIGNNLMTGLFWAEHVASVMRPKTIVVWHDLVQDETGPYRMLGYQHFADRENLPKLLLELLPELLAPA